MISKLEAIDLLKDADAGQNVYARYMAARAALDRMRGRPFDSATRLMRGMRVASRPEPGRLRARAIVSEWVGGAKGGAENPLLEEFRQSAEAIDIRRTFASYPLEDRLRMRFPRAGEAPDRLGDAILLKKRDAVTGEKGVLLISYTEAMRRLAALFDIRRVMRDYVLVFEPSWWGYEDINFLLYAGAAGTAVVQCSAGRDFDFIRTLGGNMVPVRLGAGQWMNPALFSPGPAQVKEYDVVMVSAWSPYKRHRELFETLARLRKQGRTLSVALIGYPIEWTRAYIEAMAAEYGVADCCTVFENIPQTEVASIVSASRAYVLASRREGSNRGLYEALFCDTPVVVSRRHRGVNTDHINDQTGVLFDDGRMGDAILRILDGPDTFTPRVWALANAGYAWCTARLNDTIRDAERAANGVWTQDIVVKSNSPNPGYVNVADYERFEPEYAALQEYLLPVE